mmetsp:Transcript_205/g.189  ORF Transcript_205/g.189 Transcript_205/m.189 type:complete len:508 (+) Transcript_205:201-1724(+)|eukprot:CAMPEP_0182429212 /NCGR_PEP_ID=MMETSP1167-20130531/25595_1 /TAXON_ID=2988 /ORGANISM="Mallomonas Sp, Strain CCMP3275" /LENGTH=507 /DNA_ID=CAMNT_0024612597 /DNA_START=188 /DNA_END=1711 /DNA_ORIENTATION=-
MSDDGYDMECEDAIYDDENGDEYNYADTIEDYENENEEDCAKGFEQKYSVPDGAYKTVDYKDVSPLMLGLVRDVAQLLDLSEDVSQILLARFRWDKERLIDGYYSNPEKVMMDAGLELYAGIDSVPTASIVCSICGDEAQPENTYGLGCKHMFCAICYGQYLLTSVNEGPSCIKVLCPEHMCKQIVPSSAFRKLLPTELADKFSMYYIRNFIDTSKTMRWCPAAGCEKVVIGSGVTVVTCACSHPFCFRCGEQAHDPCTCDHLKEWLEKCQNESETANWILANTKKCPECQARIEKNQGCNHMNCKVCKHEFCWICMGPWADHGSTTGGYYKCNRYDPQKPDKSQTEAQKAKAELDRYLHYYQRYYGHDAALKFAAKQREQAEQRMVKIQESEKSAWIDVQFLKQAVEQVIDCRRVLKYTYVLGFFLLDATAEKQLFEYHQEMLEKNTEELSEYTELPLESMDRSRVVNLTRVTEKFMSSLLAQMKDINFSGVIDTRSVREEKVGPG